jgi:hypothetical protein
VPEEHDVAEVFELDDVCYVGNVGVEVHLGSGEVHALAQTREGNGVDIMSLRSESTGDSLPTPATEPSATDQYMMGHPEDPLDEFIV